MNKKIIYIFCKLYVVLLIQGNLHFTYANDTDDQIKLFEKKNRFGNYLYFDFAIVQVCVVKQTINSNSNELVMYIGFDSWLDVNELIQIFICFDAVLCDTLFIHSIKCKRNAIKKTYIWLKKNPPFTFSDLFLGV